MTPLARALLGAALASCLTLLLHPASHRYMVGFVPRPADVPLIRDASGHINGTLPRPQSVAEAGLWMQLGAEKLVKAQPISDAELHNLVNLASFMSTWTTPGANEKENAFWPQMQAVFLAKLGKKAEAAKAWEDAASKTRWKDYQSSRLQLVADMLGNREGPMAWHLASVYYQRQFSVGPAILDYARRALKQVGIASKGDLEFRYKTLTNAHLMATGAQSIGILKSAAALADLAAGLDHPATATAVAIAADSNIQTVGDTTGMEPGETLHFSTANVNRSVQSVPDRSHVVLNAPIESTRFETVSVTNSDKERREMRGAFWAGLNDQGLLDEATSAKQTYDQIDSRPVLALSFKPAQTAAQLAGVSILTATLPGALMVVAAFGAVAWGIGALVLRYSGDHQAFAWPPAIAFAGVLGIGVFSITLLPLAGIVALLCSAFLVFSPKNERRIYPSELGSLFSWTVGLFALLFIVVVIAFLAELSTPGRILLPYILGDSQDYTGGRSVLVGLAAIIFAMLLLVAPMWAFARRVRTPFVLGLLFRTFGRALVAVGLIGVVVLGPLTVYADARARNTFAELVGNEPEHYYNVFE